MAADAPLDADLQARVERDVGLRHVGDCEPCTRRLLESWARELAAARAEAETAVRLLSAERDAVRALLKSGHIVTRLRALTTQMRALADQLDQGVAE